MEGATTLIAMAFMLIMLVSRPADGSSLAGTAATGNESYYSSSALPPPCFWQQFTRDGYSLAVCSVSNEILQESLPKNATAIDRFFQADNIQRRLCLRHESQPECESEPSTEYGGCQWLAGADGICYAKLDQDILRSILCPGSTALKMETCAQFTTSEECESFGPECAYDDTPLALNPWNTDTPIGPCRPADWVRLTQAGHGDQVAAKLQTYVTAALKPEDVTSVEDAEVWGTCTTADFAKETTTSTFKYLTQIAECLTLGVERCSSKPYCVRSAPAGASQAICTADIQQIRSKQFRMLMDANPTLYTRSLSTVMDQCDDIKSAKQCQEARLQSGKPSDRPVVVSTATSSGGWGLGGATNMVSTIALAVLSALLFILVL